MTRAIGRPPAWLPALVSIAALALGSACGYGLAGRSVSLPDHIKVIAVTTFVNRTSAPELDQRLTQAVLRELQSRGRWRIVPDANSPDVDAVVSGTITNVTLTPRAFNQGQATRAEAAVIANVEFKDLRNNNKVLWSNPVLTASEEYPIPAGASTSDASAFLRQNQDAYQRIAAKFARTLVASMLEGM